MWSSDLSRPLQQMLFDTADSLTGPAHPQSANPRILTKFDAKSRVEIVAGALRQGVSP